MCMGGCGKKAGAMKNSNGARQSYTPQSSARPTGGGTVARPRGNTVFGQPKIKLSFGARNR